MSRLSRRQMLRTSLGLAGLSLPEFLLRRQACAAAAGDGFGRARSCIVFFCWGGVSQLETWDPKPDAPAEIRGSYQAIASATPGIHLGEYMPLLARQTERLAIVRSVHHAEAGHRNAAYWNLTGHAPHMPGNDSSLSPSRKDWPCLGAMVGRFKAPRSGLPGSVCLPGPLADRGLLNGQDAGFLGMTSDPMLLHPGAGQPYAGVSPQTGTAELRLAGDMPRGRMQDRLQLLTGMDGAAAARSFDHYRQMATDLLLRPEVAAAFDLEREPGKLRGTYGDHVCGQSALLARRLTEAGVPLVTVYASAGDLNSGQGDHWDTHGDNFQRLKSRLLPPLEQASAALLDDLAARGRLDETLVVWLTEFGRTPKLGGNAGRDHFPHCYSVAFAGGGVRGGRVYGRSDRHASTPVERPCGPADLHATIFHALGISAEAHVTDSFGRPMALCDGRPLPLFG
jgi:Protein of unknown function (DUF1501)